MSKCERKNFNIANNYNVTKTVEENGMHNLGTQRSKGENITYNFDSLSTGNAAAALSELH